MSRSSTIESLFNVPSRYLRSVQIERDFHDVSACRDYIVTPPMTEAFLRIAEGLQDGSGRRAWRVTGDYGVGKSSFALVLAHLLFDRSPQDVSRVARAIGWPKSIRPMLPILVTGAREGVVGAIARGIAEALRNRRHQRGRIPGTVLDLAGQADLVERSGSPKDLERLIEQLRAYADDQKQGVFLVVDELGKNLEHAAQQPELEDVFVLQRLAEIASRSGERPFVLLGLLHQGFHAYTERLPSTVRNEWEKVAGRFEEIVFDQPMAHSAALVAGALNIDLRRVPSIGAAAKAATDATASIGWLGTSRRNLESFSSGRTYPIHPSVLPVVVRFFARYGQHERSLFGFLLSTEPFGLQSFAARTVDGNAWYNLSEFYDYVRAVFGHRLAGASYRNQWLRIAETIDGVSGISPLAERILKAVGVLNLLDADDLLATDASMAAAFSPAKNREVASALTELTKIGLLFRRGQTGGYRLWPHSSVNLEAAYQNAVRAVGVLETVAENILPHLESEPLLARRHYVESGTMRYFEVRYARPEAMVAAVEKKSDADGLLLLALPETQADVEEAIRVAASHAFTGRTDVVIGVPGPLRPLIADLHETKRWRWVADNTPELSEDRYALAEVSRQLSTAQRTLSEKSRAIMGISGRAMLEMKWSIGGQSVHIPRTGGASSLLSAVCDRLYPLSPLISNELLNRNTLSSAASAARMRLIEGMFKSGDKPMLGLDSAKAPPEKSMYLSVLHGGLVHVEADGIHKIVEPHAEADPLRLRPSLQAIASRIERANGARVTVSDILSELKSEPYGVRQGVAPLLLSIVLQTRGHELALYENGTFLHSVGPSDFLRLTKSPASFELQHCRVGGIRAEVFHHLALAFAESSVGGRRIDLLDVVRPLCQFAAQLPESSRRSNALGQTALKVRDALLSSREPVTLLFRDLPLACGVEEFLTEKTQKAGVVARFVETLQSAVGELRGAYPALLARIVTTVARAVNGGADGFDRATLATRAARVMMAAREPRIRTFALRLRDPGLSDEAWAESLASSLVQKPPARWAPGDENRFCEEISALAELFMKVEAAGFGPGADAPSRTALRLNLTRGDGYDFVQVIEPRSNEDAVTTDLLGVFENLLPKDKQARVDVLARLLWTELSGDTRSSENLSEADRNAASSRSSQ